ncbi:2-dehydro-3-deoxygalactonokinase [Virgibacillus senegalensis]|uniref:2-dehydro-3-deoxygalactonokinase n=1 Tax=Virgibacillus senegalensis TaxID=1499679 RepID=UPI00069CC9BD|nr:2-dehydro-3-deoxygalactonokinase [Virgibacillus senegalensis]
MHSIFIDTGTTNSRIRLLDESNGSIQDTWKLAVGVKNSAVEGSNQTLKKKLAETIKQLLEENRLQPDDISYIAASGMITSGLGLHEVNHVEAPASLADFASKSEIVREKEFYSIPTVYITGMKNRVNDDRLGGPLSINPYDVMRGEEVETFGLLHQIKPEGNGLMILPGSHTKYVLVDDHNTIRSCMSTLGGELLEAVSKQTILSSSLENRLIENVDAEKLEQGFQAASSYGLTRSLYHVRLLDLFTGWSSNQRANYLAGAVLHEDVQALHAVDQEDFELDWVIVGGSNPLRTAFYQLLTAHFSSWNVIEATDEQVDHSPVAGAREIGSIKFSLSD